MEELNGVVGGLGRGRKRDLVKSEFSCGNLKTAHARDNGQRDEKSVFTTQVSNDDFGQSLLSPWINRYEWCLSVLYLFWKKMFELISLQTNRKNYRRCKK